MKNYEEFCNYVEENILNQMSDGIKRTVSIRDVVKNNNTTLKGLTIIREDSNVSPTLYLEDFYMEYQQEDVSMDELLSRIAQCYSKAESHAYLPFDVSMLSEDCIIGSLVSTLNNEDFLQDVPYIQVNEDFALIFKYYLADFPDGGHGTITLTDNLAERCNYTTWDLFFLAFTNTPKLLPERFSSILEEVASVTCPEFLESLDEDDMSENAIPMYVLTNTSGFLGASTLLYPSVRKMLLEKFEGDLVLIPSSVHEWIIIPLCAVGDLEDLKDIIQSANASLLSSSEVLGENAYILRYTDLANPHSILPIFAPACCRE